MLIAAATAERSYSKESKGVCLRSSREVFCDINWVEQLTKEERALLSQSPGRLMVSPTLLLSPESIHTVQTHEGEKRARLTGPTGT